MSRRSLRSRRRHDAALILDEAHAIGVLGTGGPRHRAPAPAWFPSRWSARAARRSAAFGAFVATTTRDRASCCGIARARSCSRRDFRRAFRRRRSRAIEIVRGTEGDERRRDRSRIALASFATTRARRRRRIATSAIAPLLDRRRSRRSCELTAQLLERGCSSKASVRRPFPTEPPGFASACPPVTRRSEIDQAADVMLTTRARHDASRPRPSATSINQVLWHPVHPDGGVGSARHRARRRKLPRRRRGPSLPRRRQLALVQRPWSSPSAARPRAARTARAHRALDVSRSLARARASSSRRDLLEVAPRRTRRGSSTRTRDRRPSRSRSSSRSSTGSFAGVRRSSASFV